MEFEKTEVWGFEHSLRGMRNPKESHHKSDSFPITYDGKNANLYEGKVAGFYIGDNDLKLAQILIKAGSEHRKFLRQIFVSVDITAPLYWWKEYDTYKVGTVANSTSTMHKLATTPITINCFEIDDYQPEFSLDDDGVHSLINWLESLRKKYLETKDKRYWKELIRWLPESWLQTRTVTMNYENVLSTIRQRSSHKLSEWSVDFIEWAKALPYSKELLFLEDK